MKKIILWTILVCALAPAGLHAQSWTHVGPKSTNQAPDNGFQTSQMNRILVDPANTSHLFAGGRFGGLWESTDGGANWLPINTSPNQYNGIGDIRFVDNDEILVANFQPGMVIGGVHQDISTRVSRYNFVSGSWTTLTAFPNPLNTPYIINCVEVSPANTSIYFVCTSIGLFRSSNSGVSWTKVASGDVENIVFVTTGIGMYKYYVAGSDQEGDYGTPVGSAMILQSTNGTTFTPIAGTMTLPSGYIRSHARVCVATISGTDHELFVQNVATTGTPLAHDIYGWTFGASFIFKISVTFSTLTVTDLNPPGGSSGGGQITRMCIVYDPINDGVFYGEVKLRYKQDGSTSNMTVKPGFVSGASGAVHDDMHDLKMYTIGGQLYLFVACDGGIVRSPVSTYTSGNPNSVIYFSILNNGLNVCLINGFSGAAEDPDLYVIGGQDIINTDVYDASVGKNLYTHQTWENDGAFIDKFNKNNMFMDQSSYSHNYRTSEDEGATISGYKSFYDPNPTPPFASSGTLAGNHDAEQGFTTRLFYQDPYRPNRIFFGKHLCGIYQYDFGNKVFANKINMADLTGIWAEWSGGWAAARGMSFSPETPNSMHFIVNGTDPGSSGNPGTLPMVIKYIGNNLDDCWAGHYMHHDALGNPQWANLTLTLWQNLATLSGCSGCTNLSTADMYKVNFMDIETSPWNKNVIYVAVNVPNNPQIKVLKYNGSTWSNVSTGIPADEMVMAMVMDLASNDAIYLATDRAIYYKHGTSSTWTSYMDGQLPSMRNSQVEINYMDNTVRVGTYGRGIWKSPLVCPSSVHPVNNSAPIPANIYESDDITVSKNTLQVGAPTVFRATRYIELTPGFISTGNPTSNRYVLAYIHGCNTAGTSTGWRGQHAQEALEENLEPQTESNDFIVYPNPSQGEFALQFREAKAGQVDVYSIYGALVHSLPLTTDKATYNLYLTQLDKGVYMLVVTQSDGTKTTKRIILN